MTILIVDDEERDRNWLKTLLAEHLAEHMPFQEAHDGQKAVEMAIKHKPDLIFLDIKMPHLSGIKAAEQILQQLPETGVVMLSNFSDEVYVRQLWKIMPPNGTFGYVLKNVFQRTGCGKRIKPCLRRLLDTSGIAREIERTQNRATSLTPWPNMRHWSDRSGHDGP